MKRRQRLHVAFGTPRSLERRYGRRVSLSFWLAGVHIKVRTDTKFRHLKVGTSPRQSAYGTDWSRVQFYAGVFTTVDGRQVSNHGIVLTAAIVTNPSGRKIPYSPEKARRRATS